MSRVEDVAPDLVNPAVAKASGRPALSHTCEDGHHWTEQPDGGVSPSWGGGALSIKTYDQPADRCPEPERRFSRGEHGPTHGYKCPTCGEVYYAGSCRPACHAGGGDPDCAPPAPACGKPPVDTKRWDDGGRGRPGGWVPLEGGTARAAAGRRVTFLPGPPKHDGQPDPYGFGDPAGWKIRCDRCSTVLPYTPAEGPRLWRVSAAGGHQCIACAADKVAQLTLGLG